MEQVGFVKKIEGSNIELEVRRISGCGGGCNNCSSSCEVTPHIITVPNKLNAKVGDFVELKGEARNILKYVLIVYMIPFVIFIMGIILGNSIFKAIGFSSYEILSFFTGIIFLIISFFFVRLIDKKIAEKKETVISAIRIL